MIHNMEFARKIDCSCGKRHDAKIDDYKVECGAIRYLPEYISSYDAKKVFILADAHTFQAAGEKVCNLLMEHSIPFSKYVYDDDFLEPDERAVGAAFMHYDPECDLIVGVGSGVINDIAKILSHVTHKTYIIVATAPSMDGYASASSSMSLEGVKVSLPSRCPNVIIGDIDILKEAPKRMLLAGLGDILAKYISLPEWKISNIITGEYYCEETAQLVRNAIRKCVDCLDDFISGKEEAVKNVFEGLIISGIAMNYAGISRPASGVEHYFSHIWDMRSLCFHTPADLHGIQCAIGTLCATRIYMQLREITPSKEKALAYVGQFHYNEYQEALKAFVGKGAREMIRREKQEKKYDQDCHRQRLDIILHNWDSISKIIREEIPKPEDIEKILDKIGCPKTVQEIGIDSEILPMTFQATKDIRDKYVLSRLCWDLGVMDEIVW